MCPKIVKNFAGVLLLGVLDINREGFVGVRLERANKKGCGGVNSSAPTKLSDNGQISFIQSFLVWYKNLLPICIAATLRPRRSDAVR